MLLAGDIGGTKTNLAVFSSEAGWRKPYAEATYSSVNYPDLADRSSKFWRSRTCSSWTCHCYKLIMDDG